MHERFDLSQSTAKCNNRADFTVSNLSVESKSDNPIRHHPWSGHTLLNHRISTAMSPSSRVQLRKQVVICRAGGRCPNIESLPEKFRPADNLPAKICWNGFLQVNYRPERLLGGNPIMGRDFLWGRQYFNKSETYQFRDYLFTGGFFMGKTFYCDTSITLRRPLNSSSCY